ncbi:hypothetical protein CGRA01v4_04147 [Colletotrichum graminicola]|uniref:Uncharacterized protein n=1 Tax=Colletotrichum graminicola (strain M1.001 / M2 / FGSC 10212) TaxID=645133 RepID=E3QVN9_COLGM|nr:uncharacterized protein GLRG_10071 [Colletotrichum graminicola M1.001]EFQ34927.1 hypothetical protein GLRG_10071 [Colletotrichum graminicola M1.001]WDK12866.1 hypothetical protein CGRA01v4_04147 [Colletotrichum graminicola]
MEMMDMYNKISPQEENPTRTLQPPPPAPPQRQSAWMNFCVGFLMVFSIFSIGREIKQQFDHRPSLSNQVAVNRDLESWSQALDSIVAPETAEAIGNDARLKRTLMSMVEFTVDLSDQLAARYESPRLQETKEALQEYKKIIERSLGDLEGDDAKSGSGTEPEKRQLPGLGGLFGGIGGGGGGGGNMSAGILSGLLQPLTDGLKNIGSQLVRNLDGPGMFLGIGIGAGAAQGLNLSTEAKTMEVAAKVAADNKMEATGLNPAIQNLGVGLTATILGSVDLSSLSGVGGNLTLQLQPIALSLATGIGNGTVAGLKLNPNAANLEPVNDSSLPNVLGTFGFGLTKTLTSNIDTSNLLSKANNPGLTRRLMEILPAAASGLGNGLGEGATVGLGLQPDEAVVMKQMPDGSIDFGGITQTFAKALTNSLLRNGTANELLKKVNLSGSDTSRRIMEILPAAASGLGKGLGEGATVGLGLQPDEAVVMKQMPDGSIDFGGITQTFAKALTSSFLQNGTANELVNKVGSAAKSAVNGGGIPKTIDINGQTVEISKAAQGFARGFLQAAGDSIQSMGGVQSLFEGNATIPTGPPPDSKIDFDDTIGGAATGFGSGIGGQGVVVVYGLIKYPHGTNATAAGAAPALLATSAPAARRDLELVGRQRPPPIVSVDTNNGFNLSVVINAQTVSAAAQAGVNALSCQGIGGLGLIGLGLIRSKTIALDMISGGGGGRNSNITKVIKQVIPTGTIKIANEGHFYAIDGGILRDSLDGSITNAANAIEINGAKLPSWIAFLVIHILFAIVAYINVLPLAIGLEHLRSLLLRVNVPQALPKVQKWNNIMWLFVMGPSVLLVFLFGALVTAKSAHFRTAHGVISLIATLVGLGAVLLHLVVKARAPPELPRSTGSPPPPLPLTSLPNIRLMVNQLFLALSFASVITGFAGLSSVALCFTQIVPFDLALVIGFGLSTVFVLGSSISGLDLALTVRDIMKRRKGGTAGSSEAVERGDGGLQGKISAPKIVESNKEKGNFL